MNAPDKAAPMHLEAARPASRCCEACGLPFTPKRGWARFCGTPCRNAWHSWTKTVREARKLVLEALTGAMGEAWRARAVKLLGIKEAKPVAPSPEEVKA